MTKLLILLSALLASSLAIQGDPQEKAAQVMVLGSYHFAKVGVASEIQHFLSIHKGNQLLLGCLNNLQ